MEKLEERAIEILHMMCGNSGCVISDSGGKDSSVLKHIALKARERYGLKFGIRHNHTTVDAPETVYFVREEKRKYEALGIKYEIFYPAQTMWQLIVSHRTPPTRVMRYCCADLKENTGMGEKLVTGVRKAESQNRKNNQGAVTFTKPKKELLTKIEGNENFILTNRGGGSPKFRQFRDKKSGRELLQNAQNAYKSTYRLGGRFFILVHSE